MTLNEAVNAYITMRRSLGAVFSTDTRILRSFTRALGDIPLDTVDPQAIYVFCRGSGPVSYTHLTLPTICFKCRSRWSPYH